MASLPEDRPIMAALPHALAGRCPACGGAPLFRKYLKPVDRCAACAQDWSHQQADDLPAYLVIFIVGHLLVPFIISANAALDLSLVAQMILWPTTALLLSLAMLQPTKGVVIAWQWSRRMHGF
ncbi:DUF983 domain-containing protein [Sphingobium sufflavum]|uniref:DUF983 domain-containing protein n=1 Tax=Sphingobium sufflavum TaxID=1129547 RepID=UPI001F47BD97|nr:DUF983 domain-containing protein [Sphingobium sufflavum]MCE7798820.1 DUF983 domain-containing protein [Sphingobium sufflavum]